MKSLIIPASLIIFLFIGCNKDEISNEDIFSLKTVLISNSADGAGFEGRLLDPPEEDIIEIGFVWDSGISPTREKSSYYTFPSYNGFESYQLNLQHNLEKERTYRVRAYFKTIKTVEYGNEITFLSKGSKSP